MTGTNKYVSVAGTGIRFSHLIRHIYDKYYRRTRANYAERPSTGRFTPGAGAGGFYYHFDGDSAGRIAAAD